MEKHERQNTVTSWLMFQLTITDRSYLGFDEYGMKAKGLGQFTFWLVGEQPNSVDQSMLQTEDTGCSHPTLSLYTGFGNSRESCVHVLLSFNCPQHLLVFQSALLTQI